MIIIYDKMASIDDITIALQNLTLTDVTPLDQELGRGAYGKVFTVKYREKIYAAKEIHSLFSVRGSKPGVKATDQEHFSSRMLPLQSTSSSKYRPICRRLLSEKEFSFPSDDDGINGGQPDPLCKEA